MVFREVKAPVLTNRTVKNVYGGTDSYSTPPEKPTFNEKKQDRRAQIISDFETKRELDKKYGKPLPANLVENIDEVRQVISQVEANRDAMAMKKFNTNPVTNVIPKQILQFADPELTDFLAQTDLVFQKFVRKPITGAQAGVIELGNLRPLAPVGYMPPDMYILRSNTVSKAAKREFNQKLDSYKAGGFDVSGYTKYDIKPEAGVTEIIADPDFPKMAIGDIFEDDKGVQWVKSGLKYAERAK